MTTVYAFLGMKTLVYKKPTTTLITNENVFVTHASSFGKTHNKRKKRHNKTD